MNRHISIHWFRQDLRIEDNPSLTNAAKYQKTLPIYILDEENAGEFAMGSASRWWLHHSLISLNTSLDGNLSVYCGNPLQVFGEILTRFDICAVHWNRCYEPWRSNCDEKVKNFLKARGVEVKTSNGSLLWEPCDILKEDGTPYKVFTPFYRNGCLNFEQPRRPVAAPNKVKYFRDRQGISDINNLNLLPKIRWDARLAAHWKIGEESAQNCLSEFISEALGSYKDGRNFPSKPFVSRLSSHLHHGEISPNQIWYAVKNFGNDRNVDHFCSELGWREFSYNLLYHNPELPRANLNSKFDSFPWVQNWDFLRAWQKGLTGIPMVDAGMRELWQTGYIHNRARMIVGSFLVKNLLLHWHHGERWFWDTLVDADLASNSASWQWIAGCGADAAPYFRIFNPVKQGQKFDSDGSYVRRFIPEISTLPNKFLFSPWEAPQNILLSEGIFLGSTYPEPIVDLKKSRETALKAFQSLKEKS